MWLSTDTTQWRKWGSNPSVSSQGLFHWATVLPLSCRPKYLGDNHIQNFHLGRYIVGYMVGNLVLRWRASRAVKHDFWAYIWLYTSPNNNFEYGYPHFNALLHIRLDSMYWKPQAIQRKVIYYWCQTISCSISQDILSQIFYVIQSDVALQKQVH